MKASVMLGATGHVTQSWLQARKGIAVVKRNMAKVEITQEQVNALAAQYDVREALKQEEQKREVANAQRKATGEINKALDKAFKI